MEFLVGCLCMSIGCAVAWPLALYTSRGELHLIRDMLFGSLGAAACAGAVAHLAPGVAIIILVTAGPVCALLAILAVDAVVHSIFRRGHTIE